MTFLFRSLYLPPQNSGPCNSFHCLGHFKNVHDDDDDDDDSTAKINHFPVLCSSPTHTHLLPCGHDFVLSNIKYDFNKRYFIACSLFVLCLNFMAHL